MNLNKSKSLTLCFYLGICDYHRKIIQQHVSTTNTSSDQRDASSTSICITPVSGDVNKENETDEPVDFKIENEIDEPVDFKIEDKRKRKSSFIATERLNLLV